MPHEHDNPIFRYENLLLHAFLMLLMHHILYLRIQHVFRGVLELQQIDVELAIMGRVHQSVRSRYQ